MLQVITTPLRHTQSEVVQATGISKQVDEAAVLAECGRGERDAALWLWSSALVVGGATKEVQDASPRLGATSLSSSRVLWGEPNIETEKAMPWMESAFISAHHR